MHTPSLLLCIEHLEYVLLFYCPQYMAAFDVPLAKSCIIRRLYKENPRRFGDLCTRQLCLCLFALEHALPPTVRRKDVGLTGQLGNVVVKLGLACCEV